MWICSPPARGTTVIILIVIGASSVRNISNVTNSTTISYPWCQKLFFGNDLLQRHLTLKHGKDGWREALRRSSSTNPNPGSVGMGNHALHNLDESLLLDGAFFPPPEPGHEQPGNPFDESEIVINGPSSRSISLFQSVNWKWLFKVKRWWSQPKGP